MTTLGVVGMDFLPGLLLHDAGTIGGPLKGLVVRDNQHAVLGHADIGLETGVADFMTFLESRKGVFVVFQAAAAMRKSADGLVLGEGVRAHKRQGGQTKEQDSFHVRV